MGRGDISIFGSSKKPIPKSNGRGSTFGNSLPKHIIRVGAYHESIGYEHAGEDKNGNPIFVRRTMRGLVKVTLDKKSGISIGRPIVEQHSVHKWRDGRIIMNGKQCNKCNKKDNMIRECKECAKRIVVCATCKNAVYKKQKYCQHQWKESKGEKWCEKCGCVPELRGFGAKGYKSAAANRGGFSKKELF